MLGAEIIVRTLPPVTKTFITVEERWIWTCVTYTPEAVSAWYVGEIPYDGHYEPFEELTKVYVACKDAEQGRVEVSMMNVKTRWELLLEFLWSSTIISRKDVMYSFWTIFRYACYNYVLETRNERGSPFAAAL